MAYGSVVGEAAEGGAVMRDLATTAADRKMQAAYLVDAIRQLNEAEEVGDLAEAAKGRAYVARCLKALAPAARHPQPIWKRIACKLGFHGGPWYAVYLTKKDWPYLGDSQQIRCGATCACQRFFTEEKAS